MPPHGLRSTFSSLRGRTFPPIQRTTVLPIRIRAYVDPSSKKPSGQAGVDAAIKGPTPEQTEGKGPNEEQLPHVSEEAAAIKQVKGEEGPDVDQGTRVEDILKRDKDLKGQLPKVMADALKKDNEADKSNNKTGGKREYSTFARTMLGRRSFSSFAIHRNEEMQTEFGPDRLLRERMEIAKRDSEDFAVLNEYLELPNSRPVPEPPYGSNGLVFAPAATPTSKQANFKTRHEPIVDQVTKLLMRSGKLSKAQRDMAMILNHLRTAPAPKRAADSKGNLLGSPTLQNLPLEPVQYLTLAIDSVAPLFRLRSQSGLAGGGVSLQIPVPLWERQRRRTAIKWILEAVENKSRGGSISPFPRRFGEEIVSIVEGKSSVWEKRRSVHALGVRARANLRIVRR